MIVNGSEITPLYEYTEGRHLKSSLRNSMKTSYKELQFN